MTVRDATSGPLQSAVPAQHVSVFLWRTNARLISASNRPSASADNVTWIREKHTFALAAINKRHSTTRVCRKSRRRIREVDSFTQLLTGNAQDADTQFGSPARHSASRTLAVTSQTIGRSRAVEFESVSAIRLVYVAHREKTAASAILISPTFTLLLPLGRD